VSDDSPLNDGDGASSRSRVLVAACLVLFGIVYLLYIAAGTFRTRGRFVGTLFDDALISMRYAQHLVGGHGLVWNIGERPPIEGYTNLGWTLVMALVAEALPYDTAPIGVSLVGAVMLLVSGVVAYGLLSGIGASRRASIAGMLLVLAAYPTVFWTLRGMEVGALALLLLIALRLALVSRRRQQGFGRLLLIGTIAGVALLTRNDAVLMFLPVFVYAAWRHGRLLTSAVAALPVAACAGAQVLFRYAYYGELTPNTYVLKMTGAVVSTRITAGVVSLVDTFPLIAPAVVVIAAVALAVRVPARVRDCSRLALATLLLQWAYLVWIGGDAWLINYSNRFIAAVLPMLLVSATAATPACLDVLRRSKAGALWFLAVSLLLLVTLGLHHPHTFASGPQWLLLAGWLLLPGIVLAAQASALQDGLRTDRVIGAAAFALFLVSSAHGWLAWTLYQPPKAPDDIAFARLGLMLRDAMPADAVIAAGWVGAPAYYSRLPAVDLLGKTDAHVARAPASGVFRPGHDKMDLAYSIGQLQPDVVLLDNPVVGTYGYVRLPNGLWVRRDSPVPYGAALRASWCTSQSESVYCPDVPIASR
jgi:hypothetical protein